jgi:hypothetical protein
MQVNKLIQVVFVLLALSSCNALEDQGLSTIEEQVKNINAKCPATIDSDTRLDKVELAEGPTLSYYYTLTKIRSLNDTIAFKQALWPGLLAGVRTNSAMQALKDAQYKIAHVYRSVENKYLCSVVIGPEDYK